jgi:soluble lytic murein transglycosylase-like protein
MPSLVNASLPQMIYDEASAQGVPPSIALAVAQQESGISQWQANGNLVTGSSGEIGVFQIMPGTAAGLGIDPSDVDQNISGGISFLAQLYQKYGNWVSALSAYNSGSPTGSLSYANSVLTIAGGIPDSSDNSSDSGSTDLSMLGDVGSIDPTALIIGGLVAVLAVVWWMD